MAWKKGALPASKQADRGKRVKKLCPGHCPDPWTFLEKLWYKPGKLFSLTDEGVQVWTGRTTTMAHILLSGSLAKRARQEGKRHKSCV